MEDAVGEGETVRVADAHEETVGLVQGDADSVAARADAVEHTVVVADAEGARDALDNGALAEGSAVVEPEEHTLRDASAEASGLPDEPVPVGCGDTVGVPLAEALLLINAEPESDADVAGLALAVKVAPLLLLTPADAVLVTVSVCTGDEDRDGVAVPPTGLLEGELEGQALADALCIALTDAQPLALLEVVCVGDMDADLLALAAAEMREELDGQGDTDRDTEAVDEARTERVDVSEDAIDAEARGELLLPNERVAAALPEAHAVGVTLADTLAVPLRDERGDTELRALAEAVGVCEPVTDNVEVAVDDAVAPAESDLAAVPEPVAAGDAERLGVGVAEAVPASTVPVAAAERDCEAHPLDDTDTVPRALRVLDADPLTPELLVTHAVLLALAAAECDADAVPTDVRDELGEALPTGDDERVGARDRELTPLADEDADGVPLSVPPDVRESNGVGVALVTSDDDRTALLVSDCSGENDSCAVTVAVADTQALALLVALLEAVSDNDDDARAVLDIEALPPLADALTRGVAVDVELVVPLTLAEDELLPPTDALVEPLDWLLAVTHSDGAAVWDGVRVPTGDTEDVALAVVECVEEGVVDDDRDAETDAVG